MPMYMCRLEAQWNPISESEGQFEFALLNLSDETLSGFKLAYTSLTRVVDRTQSENAVLLNRSANFHEFAPPEGFVLKPGAAWHFKVGGLNRVARHRTDGVSTAYLTLADGRVVDIASGSLMLKGRMATQAPALVPEGVLDMPVAILPWPKNCTLSGFESAPIALYPGSKSGLADFKAMADVTALSQRLFPQAFAPFALTEIKGGRAVTFSHDAGLGEEEYRLDFTPDTIALTHGGGAGVNYGLITLAQMLHAAHAEPERFRFPTGGQIDDAPRYGWRGCHLDVSRQVYSIASVRRFIDILAWNKMNVLHWHLTDDEGWRLEIKAYPELTEIGSKRGPREKMPAQLGSGAETCAGHFTQDEVRALVADAGRLHVAIMPEFDIPGHCTAVLNALPHLVDADETSDSYHSVQGYANNALNPAMPETYAFLETVLGEIAGLFPFAYIHVGGDEVAPGSWLASPRAQALMAEQGLAGTNELQAHLLRRVKSMLTRLGKKMAGWDEISHGGGVDTKDTLLMAWQNAEVGSALAREGYEVVMTPGQAYYLDMVQADDWLEPGASWAGTVPPKWTYEFEAAGNFPAGLADKLQGIQGGIWSENLVSRDMFNHMVFPRLGAIAEAAWTPKSGKNWQRFAAISKLMPKL